MLSGKNTLDVILGKTLKYLSTSDLNDMTKPFIFSYYKHDTGCDVIISIARPDNIPFRIQRTTYWYSSVYTFNKDDILTGAWDDALENTINKLETFVKEQEEMEKSRKEILEKQKQEKLQKETEEVEKMFK